MDRRCDHAVLRHMRRDFALGVRHFTADVESQTERVGHQLTRAGFLIDLHFGHQHVAGKAEYECVPMHDYDQVTCADCSLTWNERDK